MSKYHYTESGLNNVWVEGATFAKDDAGEETICIPNISNLHRVIADGIIVATRKVMNNCAGIAAEMTMPSTGPGPPVSAWK